MSIKSIIVTLIGLTGLMIQSALAESPADAAFWDSVYSENRVLDIEISLTREAWDEMEPRSAKRRTGENAPKIDFGNKFAYVRADVMINGDPFENSGLRFKGNSSYRFSSGDLKKPLKLDLNRFSKGQKLHGRTKLNLSNAFLDPAFMKEKLGYELYHAAGLATPGVGWANVTLTVEGLADKKRLGIYVLIEQVDERFLVNKLGTPSKGSLLMKPESVDDWEYLGDDINAYERYNIKLGGKNEDQIRQFAGLLKLIEKAPDAEFEREIGNRMDLEQFAAYLAATSILVNIDSYIGMPHNYYLLMDRADNKLRMLPWDLNETFGTFTMGRNPETLVEWDIDRPWISKRRLLERLFATDGFPKLYQTKLEELMENEFTKDQLFARIAAFEKAIVPHLSNDTEGRELKELRMGIDGDESGINTAEKRRIFAIKPFIEKRIESVEAQLAGTSDGEVFGRRPKR